MKKHQRTKLNRIWKDISFGGRKKEKELIRATQDHVDMGHATKVGQVLEVTRYLPISTDPSIKNQLYERKSLSAEERLKAYLNACALAPHASPSTKRKWRKALEGGAVLEINHVTRAPAHSSNIILTSS